jgi:hypothetical protein
MPQEAQEQNIYRIYGFAEKLRRNNKVKHGSKNIVRVGEFGFLSIVLYDDSGSAPIVNTDYQIEGDNGRSYSGTTDDEGFLFHPDVPISDYNLTVGGKTVRAPVVLEQEDRHLQRVIGYVIS